MQVNQKILELVGLLHVFQRLEKNLDDREELLNVAIQKRDEILLELSVDHISDSEFLTPQEKEYLLKLKQKK